MDDPVLSQAIVDDDVDAVAAGCGRQRSALWMASPALWTAVWTAVWPGA